MSKNKEIIATGTGGLIGVIGAGTGIYCGGAVVGTSATGLTSGLAAVGSIIGGGMVAGIVVTTIAPLATGALGYGLYKLFK